MSDPSGLVASVRESIKASDIAGLDALIAEVEPVEIIVGLPMGLDGTVGKAALGAREFAQDLSTRTGIAVRLVDERLSTVQAQRGFHDQGRSVRKSRTMIDSASAQVVLQHALDAERSTGQAPGELCEAP